jgi:hypothetical protein
MSVSKTVQRKACCVKLMLAAGYSLENLLTLAVNKVKDVRG